MWTTAAYMDHLLFLESHRQTPVLLFLMFAIPYISNVRLSPECSPGVRTPGVTVPRGDIILEEGFPLELLCILDINHPSYAKYNSSQLVFYHGDHLVPDKYLTVVNDTVLRLYDARPLNSSSMYYCKLYDGNGSSEVVCLNQVTVGYKPQEVLNFSCISHNWENFTCTWTVPQNYVKTSYKLVYYLPGRAGRKFFYTCPEDNDVKKNKCFWDDRTIPPYRQAFQYYHFNMTGINALGKVSRDIRFHHFGHVVPARASNLLFVGKTSFSIAIQWSVGFPMQNFPPGVAQKVEYQSQWDSRDSWQVADTSLLNFKTANHSLNLTGLQHAYCFYDIRVFMRSAEASGEDGWSQPATITVKTKSAIPNSPPRTDIGSFETVDFFPLRDIYLYWQQIPQYDENGDSFEYKIMYLKENGILKQVIPNEITKSYAKFSGMRDEQHHFKIYSANLEGLSEGSSDIVVTRKVESPQEPRSVTKILFDNRIYELSWKAPSGNDVIDNYTIFWCANPKDRPFQCTGYLEWKTAARNWTIMPDQYYSDNVTVSKDEVYQFAVSANSKRGSSGMVWASCTVIHNKVVDKIKYQWVSQIGSTFMELYWRLDCSDRIGIVIAYNIYYCPIVSLHSQTCKGNELYKKLEGDSLTMNYNLTGLIPYTTYLVRIAVLTKNGEGLKSEPLNNTTLEAAPDTPPQDVFVLDVSNNSLVVSWKEPSRMNGLLRYYEVHWNNNKTKVEQRSSVKLQNLNSFTKYTISVTACTVSCSERSQPIVIKTGIGVPSQMEPPYVRFINSSHGLVSWSPPLHTGGALDYYEIRLVVSDDFSEPLVLRYNSTKTAYHIPDLNCYSTYKIYKFKVRAVNVGPDSRIYAGDWSRAGEGNCFTSSWPTIWLVPVIILIVVFVALLCILIGCVLKRVWICYKEMQDIEIKIPDAMYSMADYHREEGNDGVQFKQAVQSWPPPPCGSVDSDVRPFEKLLLHSEIEEETNGNALVFDGNVDVEKDESCRSSISEHEGTIEMQQMPFLHNTGSDQYVRMGSRSVPTAMVDATTDLGYCKVGTNEGGGGQQAAGRRETLERPTEASSTIPAAVAGGYVAWAVASSSRHPDPDEAGGGATTTCLEWCVHCTFICNL